MLLRKRQPPSPNLGVVDDGNGGGGDDACWLVVVLQVDQQIPNCRSLASPSTHGRDAAESEYGSSRQQDDRKKKNPCGLHNRKALLDHKMEGG